MSWPGGYTGKILHVDLTSGTSRTEPLPEPYVRAFLGGAGINAKLAWDALAPGTAPFSPGNVLAFGAGPLVGTLAPGAGKCNVTGKSPHRGILAGSGHGLLGMLKFTGHDHLVVTGRSRVPVCLRITDDRVEFVDASDLRGRDIWETTDALWSAFGSDYAVTAIGPAGENRLKDAAIVTDKYATMARSGLGGVMGSKNLKAIALKGTRSVHVADPGRFLELADELHGELRSHPNLPEWRRYGTLISLETFAKLGIYAARNFQSGYGEELLDDVNLEGFLELKKGDVSCMACPVGCKHYLEVDADEDWEKVSATVSCCNAALQSFGTFLDVKSWKWIVRLASLACRLGLDFYSAGGLLSLAMELHQRGILEEAKAGGLDLSWGNAEGAAQLLRQIAHKTGLGALLCEGLDAAPALLGDEAAAYAMQTKGHALFYDPRVRPGSTEIFSQFTNVRGHTSNVSIVMVPRTPDQVRRFAERAGIPEHRLPQVLSGPEGYNVARLTKWCEDIGTVMECMGVCMFPLYQRIPLSKWKDLYEAATGVSTTVEGLFRNSENLWDARRAFSLREGLSARDDGAPRRFLEEGVPAGNAVHAPLGEEDFRRFIHDYYEERGWHRNTGAVRPDRLRELGLTWDCLPRDPG